MPGAPSPMHPTPFNSITEYDTSDVKRLTELKTLLLFTEIVFRPENITSDLGFNFVLLSSCKYQITKIPAVDLK